MRDKSFLLVFGSLKLEWILGAWLESSFRNEALNPSSQECWRLKALWSSSQETGNGNPGREDSWCAQGHVPSLEAGYMSEGPPHSWVPAEMNAATTFQFDFLLCWIAVPSHGYRYCSWLTNKLCAESQGLLPGELNLWQVSVDHIGNAAQEACTSDSGGQQRWHG